MSVAHLFIHLPGLRAFDGAMLAGGVIERLPFDQWRRLDAAMPHTATKYEAWQPWFWHQTIPAEAVAPADGAAPVVHAHARQLHLALLLHPQAPLIAAPIHSCCYVLDEDGGRPRIRQLIGRAEREWVVFGGIPERALDEDDLGHVERACRLLGDVDLGAPGHAPLAGALATLERTSAPEYCFDEADEGARLSGYVQAIAACEGLLTGEGRSALSLTESFGRNAAALLAAGDAGAAAVFADMYRLRSRLIHGRIAVSRLEPEQVSMIGEGRLLLRNCCVFALALAGDGLVAADLPCLLADPGAAPGRLDAIRARLEAP